MSDYVQDMCEKHLTLMNTLHERVLTFDNLISRLILVEKPVLNEQKIKLIQPLLEMYIKSYSELSNSHVLTLLGQQNNNPPQPPLEQSSEIRSLPESQCEQIKQQEQTQNESLQQHHQHQIQQQQQLHHQQHQQNQHQQQRNQQNQNPRQLLHQQMQKQASLLKRLQAEFNNQRREQKPKLRNPEFSANHSVGKRRNKRPRNKPTLTNQAY